MIALRGALAVHYLKNTSGIFVKSFLAMQLKTSVDMNELQKL